MYLNLFTDRNRIHRTTSMSKTRLSEDSLLKCLEPLVQLQQETNTVLKSLQVQMRYLQRQNEQRSSITQGREWLILAVVLTFQIILQWIFK